MVDNSKLPEMGSILYLQHLAEFEVAEGGNYLQGTITHVSDPCNFYLYPQNRKRKQFIELSAQLQKECKLAKPCDIANLQPGRFYAAYRNTEWLRVLLEKIVGPGKGWVFYIDTGYRETLSLVKLRPLSERYQTIPAQAFLCQLVSIIPPSQKDAALSEICTSIKKMLKNSFVTVFVEDEFEGWVGQLQKNETKLFVTAYVGDEEMSINSKVTQAGYGISLKRHEESWHQKVRKSLSIMEKQEKPVITYAKVAASKNAIVSNGPKQLLVSVCHVVDPGKFFVHCKYSEVEGKQLRYLRYLLDKSADLSPATEIQVGQLYAVFDGKNQHWYRGQCLRDIVEEEASEVLFEFFMIDEGHHQTVPISSVRMLTPDLLQIRPMALECSLSGGPPPGDGRWLPPAIALFKQLTQRSQLKMTVFSNDGGTLKVDLAQMASFPGEEVIASLRDAVLLMPKNLSSTKSVPVSRTPVVQSPSASSGRKFFSKFAQIVTGTRLHGKVVQVSNPCSFYVHFDESGPEEFAEMHRELQEELNQPGVKGSLAVRTVQLGSPYVICRNQIWYRALVEEILGNGNIVVFLVDYGQRLSVTVPELRQIPDRFLDIPAQLTYCKLDLVRPDPTTGIWTNESKCFFKQLVSDARVTAFVQGKVIGRVGRALIKELALFVILYVGDDKVSVNTKLTSAGHGVSRANQGCHESPTHHRPDTSSSARPEAVVMPNAVPALFPVERAAQLQQSPCSASASLPSHPSPPASTNSTTSPPKEEHSFCTLDPERIPEVAPVPGYWTTVNANHVDACTTDVLAAEVTDLESLHFFDIDESVQIYGTMPGEADYVMAVRFLACESPEAIYFRPLPYEAKYRELHFQLQSAYSASVFHQSYNFNPGMWCAAYVYGRWIRAVVNDFDEELQCSVTSVDSGQSYQVMIDQIFPLVEPFSSIRRLALKCSLAGLKPTNGVWTTEVRSKITRALLGADQVFVCCPSRPKAIPSTMSVTIVYRQSTENGRVLVNLNEYLVKENAASVASNSNRHSLAVHRRC